MKMGCHSHTEETAVMAAGSAAAGSAGAGSVVAGSVAESEAASMRFQTE